MLSLYTNDSQIVIANDDYYIRQMASGLDEVVFTISIWDEVYPQLVEEASIRDRDQQWYLIKQIDAGNETAKIVAQIDLDAWKSEMLIGYSNNSATLYATINGVLPTGWLFLDNSGLTMQRTIEGDYTPLEIVDACRDTYGVYFKFDNVSKTITALLPDEAEPLGAFATRDLNLKEINYKGKSNDIVTRLYAYGADGLSFASINSGLPYVENFTYSDRIVCAVWRDDRYTIAENLLADAKKKLSTLAIPTRSYECDVVDLRSTNPEMYGFLDFDIFSVATLIDDAKNFAINYQVVERWDYPYYPEKNKVIFSSSPAKIQNQVKHLAQQIENANSPFRQQQQTAINNATNWITGAKGGYVVINKNSQDQPYEILIMDTPDISTAKNVWRWNQGGLGFSSSGYNGPYATAITQDGSIVASFITTGILTGNLIQTGTIQSPNGRMTINLDQGKFSTWGISSLTGEEIIFNFNNGTITQMQGSLKSGEWYNDNNVGILATGQVDAYGINILREFDIDNKQESNRITVAYHDEAFRNRITLAGEAFRIWTDTTGSGKSRLFAYVSGGNLTIEADVLYVDGVAYKPTTITVDGQEYTVLGA